MTTMRCSAYRAGRSWTKLRDTRDDVDVALTARVRIDDVLRPLDLEPRDRSAVEHPVVALAQSPVVEDRQPAPTEGDLGGLDGAARSSRDRHDLVVRTALPELFRLSSTEWRELAVEPARRDPTLVVGRRRVRLEDDLDARRRRRLPLLRLVLEPEETDGAGAGVGADDGAERRGELDLRPRPDTPYELGERADPLLGVLRARSRCGVRGVGGRLHEPTLELRDRLLLPADARGDDHPVVDAEHGSEVQHAAGDRLRLPDAPAALKVLERLDGEEDVAARRENGR